MLRGIVWRRPGRGSSVPRSSPTLPRTRAAACRSSGPGVLAAASAVALIAWVPLPVHGHALAVQTLAAGGDISRTRLDGGRRSSGGHQVTPSKGLESALRGAVAHRASRPRSRRCRGRPRPGAVDRPARAAHRPAGRRAALRRRGPRRQAEAVPLLERVAGHRRPARRRWSASTAISWPGCGCSGQFGMSPETSQVTSRLSQATTSSSHCHSPCRSSGSQHVSGSEGRGSRGLVAQSLLLFLGPVDGDVELAVGQPDLLPGHGKRKHIELGASRRACSDVTAHSLSVRSRRRRNRGGAPQRERRSPEPRGHDHAAVVGEARAHRPLVDQPPLLGLALHAAVQLDDDRLAVLGDHRRPPFGQLADLLGPGDGDVSPAEVLRVPCILRQRSLHGGGAMSAPSQDGRLTRWRPATGRRDASPARRTVTLLSVGLLLAALAGCGDPDDGDGGGGGGYIVGSQA